MSRLKGYIFSRDFMGERAPQHIQNIVLREYCHRNNHNYILSGTEYAMANCYFMLTQIIDQLDEYDGIIAYSVFQLPKNPITRNNFLKKIVGKNKSMHFALEQFFVASLNEIDRISLIWEVKNKLDQSYLYNNTKS